ncbi:hypothetical protein QTP88_028302 [Uroleucon formosanum]
MLITIILMTLPDSYRHFYSAWDSMNSANRTLEQLTTRLMVEETRQVQGREARDDGAESIDLTANKSKYNKSQKYVNYNNNTKPGKCNHYKKPGHWKRDCRIFKKEQEEKESTSILALIGVQRKIEEIDDSDKWYVDSGASDHMTNRKEWFVNFHSFYSKYFDVHSPVRIGDVKFDSIRSILAISAVEQLQLRLFDVQTAFLYEDLDEEIYMRQPEGFNDGTEMVCRLQRSLYGLMQSPRCWNKMFKIFLLNFNLLETKADTCVFVNRENNKVLITAIFVDDGLVATTSSTEIEQKSDGSTVMHQRLYCKRILEEFNIPFQRRIIKGHVPEEEFFFQIVSK